MSFTVAGSTYGGFLTASAAGAAQSTATAQLNWNPGEVTSNTAMVAVGYPASSPNGAIQVYVSNSTAVIVDMQGYILSGGSAGGGGFVPLDNGGTRIVDTRIGQGEANGQAVRLPAGATLTVTAEGAATGIPSTARAMFANITVLSYDAVSGYVTTGPTGAPQPSTALDYVGNQITALASTVDLNANRQFTLYVGNVGEQPLDVVIDVQGYYDGTPNGGAFTPQNVRVYDSRATARLQPNTVTKVQVTGVNGFPSGGPVVRRR